MAAPAHVRQTAAQCRQTAAQCRSLAQAAIRHDPHRYPIYSRLITLAHKLEGAADLVEKVEQLAKLTADRHHSQARSPRRRGPSR